MGETQTQYPESGPLDELAVFDAKINNRIDQILAGLSPNGESPNGVLTRAVEGGEPEDHQAFTEEYHWALALAVYPHRDKETREVLMSAATDGLYVAGETYDPDTEPNFLKHLAATVVPYLQEVFGEADTSELPPPHEFESFVLSLKPVVEEAPFVLLEPVEVEEIDFEEDELPVRRPYTPRPVPTDKGSIEYLEWMSPSRRLAAYYAGELTRRQRTVWSARFPDEVPLINGEFEWIAHNLADFD